MISSRGAGVQTFGLEGPPALSGRKPVAVKLYVGNLPWAATEDELRGLFANYGSVVSARIIRDRETGDPRGFGFVEMLDRKAALSAIESLDGAECDGRYLRVSEAHDRGARGRP